MPLFLRRLFACAIDYLIIIIYGGLLFCGVLLFGPDLDEFSAPSPVKGQLIGFVSMTLPVFLYFFLFESSKSGGTVGKRLMHIRVSSLRAKGSRRPFFLRNFLKFLPWEIAHVGVHWLFATGDGSVAWWIWILTILPQITVLWYAVSVLMSYGKTSVYDRIGRTEVVVVE